MLVAFSHLYPRNKVEIRSNHYEYQTTEVRLKQSEVDLQWRSLFYYDELFLQDSININIYR